MPRSGSLSLAASVWEEDGVVQRALPREVSVPLSPADEDALILCAGERARAVWDLLARASQQRGPSR